MNPYTKVYGWWITTLTKLSDGMVILAGWTICESKELALRSISKDAKETFKHQDTTHFETKTTIYVLEPLRSGVVYNLGTDRPQPFKWDK